MTCTARWLQSDMPRLLLCLGFAGLAAGPLAAQPADSPTTISGTLVDERGAPLADVEVVLRPYPGDYEVGLQLLGVPDALPGVVDRTRSGADGSYSVSASLPGPYRLEFHYSASADQPVPAQPVVIGNLAPLQGSRLAETIEVPNRHLVAVRVLDADGGPVEGALVIAHPTLWMSPRYLNSMTQMLRDARAGNYSRPQEQRVFPTYHPAASRTDSEGIARFLMPTEEANVLVSAPGLKQSEAGTTSGRAALRLEGGPGIRFRVRGSNGAPVPGVLIRTSEPPPPTDAPTALTMLRTPGALGTPGTPLAVTDQDGEAVVSGVSASPTTWELLGADRAFAEVSVPAPEPGASSEAEQIVDVRLDAPRRIPGRVVDTASGLPLDGAAIWVQAFPGNSATSGPSGAFDLTTRPASTGTRLLVTAAGYLDERTDVAASDALNTTEVKIGLTPAAPIAGVVTDGSGQPVAGAKIWAEPRGRGGARFSSSQAGPAYAAPDGSFVVEGALYGQAYRLTAEAPGYARTLLNVPPVEPGRVIEPVHLTLSRGRRVVGTVVDTEGNPVTGAQVELRWPLDPSDFRSLAESPATAATTNDQGAFVLPATAAGEYGVDASHSEYAQRPTTLVDLPEGESDFEIGDLTLVAGSTIHGIVTGPEGTPVAGASIQSIGEYRTGGAPIRTATADGDGRFRIEGLSSALVDLGVRATGYPVLTRAGVRTNNDDPVLLELKPGASLTGRVLDGGGNEVAGTVVSLRIEFDYLAGGDPQLWDAADTFPRRRTDAEGRFRFEGLMAGTWSAEAKRGTDGAKLDQIELAPGAEREIELLLQARDRLTVIVTTSAGEPVANAEIRIQSAGERIPGGYGRTDGSGRSEMDITAGPVTVKVTHQKLRDESREVQLEPGDNELRLELRPGAEITGTVRSYDGARLAQATVAAETEYEFGAESHRTNTVSDQNGAFRVTGLEPRRYIVTARSPGYADGGPDEPIEIGDDSVEGIEIVLEPEVSIAGTVTGLSLTDLTQVRVYARRGSRSRDATTDTEGNFSIKGVGPGTWNVRAIKGDWERTVERTVTIDRGATEVLVELPFERGLRLSGQVVEAGAPLIGARLFVEEQSTRTDQEGRFALEGLKPGPSQVIISRPDFSGTQYQSIDLQTDMEGVRIELEPAAATVAGVVVDAETGQPLDYASLMAADAATIGVIAKDGAAGALLVGVSSVLTRGAGQFTLELRANVDHLWVTRDRYEGTQIPLDITPGEHLEGLVIRLQPAADESPDQ